MKKKKTHSNETMKPHFKFIYTRKLFLNCKLLTMSSLQIIKTCQLRMEMWKKNKIEKNKEKCRKYYEKKREEGTNAKNRK